MQLATRLISRRWYQSKLFWLLVVILLYTLIGFFLVPYLIKSYTEDAVQERFGWTGGPAEVSFNPFEMALRVNDFEVRDNSDTRVLAFSELLVNFDLGSIYYWAWTLEPSHLNNLYALVQIDESAETNFGKAWAAHNEPVPEEQQDEKKEPQDEQIAGTLPRILLKEIMLADGQIKIEDSTQGTTIIHEISPLDLLISDFVTYEDSDGRYVASLTLGESQKLKWEGSIDAEPYYRSNGSLELSAFNLGNLWPYVQPYVNYRVSSGSLDASADYVFSWQPEAQQALHLQVSNGHAEITDLAAAIPENNAFETAELGTIDRMGVRGLNYDYNQENLDIREAYLNKLDLMLIRNAQNQINVAWPYTGAPTGDKASSDKPAESDSSANGNRFKWHIELVDLSDSRVTWKDKTLENTASINVEKISAQIHDLNQNLDEAKTFSLSLAPEQSGPVEMNGTLIPAKAQLEATVEVEKLHVPLAQPYVNQFINLQLNKGALTVKGELVLTGETSIGHFSGTVDVDNFDATDPLLKAELIGWKSMRSGPMRAAFAQPTVTIDTLTVIEPYGQFRISDSGETNFSALFPDKPEGANTGTAPEASAQSGLAVEPKAEVNIARVLFENGRVYFEDNSIEPSVVLPMKQLGGAITGISSRPDNRSEVDLAGVVGEHGTVTIQGKLDALAEQLYLDLGLVVENFHLSTVSPYAAKYIGRKIERGQLKLNLNYHVEAGELEASNDIVIEDLSLGESVTSDEAVDLPISLAVALLKDASGTISLDVPVNGSLKDPDFSLDKVIWQAFTNLLKTAVTSPFKLIGSLIGSSGDDIQKVDFEAGSSQLSSAAEGSLQSLSTALKERPELRVEVRGKASRAIDAPALAQSQLATDMDQRNLMGGDDIASYEDYLKAKGANLPERTRKQAQETDSDAPKTGLSQEQISDEQYLAQLKQAAADSIQITDERLQKLALERSEKVYQSLVESNGLEQAQLSSAEPDVDTDSAESDQASRVVSMPFDLHAH